MEMKKIKLSHNNVQILRSLNNVRHHMFQNGINNHWQVIAENGKEFVTPQSFCWLYCWASTGMNSSNAKEDAELAFNLAFDFSFHQIDNESLHRLARRLRYKKNIESKDLDELRQYL
ncbi:hypothetical protein LJC73_00545 [Bacteroidales bacterium OttesenSCG-928-L14]|nr:hypothetical protein [Bacteroidales bacterium OttesenSCG-928-L14]